MGHARDPARSARRHIASVTRTRRLVRCTFHAEMVPLPGRCERFSSRKYGRARHAVSQMNQPRHGVPHRRSSRARDASNSRSLACMPPRRAPRAGRGADAADRHPPPITASSSWRRASTAAVIGSSRCPPQRAAKR
eukprot:1597093-Prymnesium_polylepis.1